MLLTVGQLKEAFADIDDKTIIGSMVFGSGDEVEMFAPKRILITKGSNGQEFFVLNNMGTHWNDSWAKSNDMTVVREIDINCHEKVEEPVIPTVKLDNMEDVTKFLNGVK